MGGREVAIAFDGVTKRYGPVQALGGASFAIERGEMVALLGPNGAGKSTTVDLMLGLRQPDTGSVRILGSPPKRAVEDGRVGAMLQSGSLPERATVREVVDLARRLYGSQRSLTALLDLAELRDLAGRRTDRLSGGQALVLSAGSLPFTIVGLVIGEAFDGQAANSATLFTVLGLSFAGGLLIPDSQLPSAVRDVAVVLPSRQLADLARAAASGHQPSVLGVEILAAWALALGAAALMLRRREAAA